MRVTGIERRPGSRSVNVRLDGSVLLKISTEVLSGFGLRAGDELPQTRLKEIREAQRRHSTLASALRLLAYRPRSEAEMRERLARRKAPPALLEAVIARLRELSLLDDGAFARTWVEGRERSSPRSRRLLAAELRAKGVPAAVAERSVAAVDEAEAAYRAARKRAASLGNAAYPDFRRRLGDFLLRRGFDLETAQEAVRRLWEELRGEQPAHEEMGN